ncbi:BA14K family protein [Bradyrhizobium sp. 5.13L]
MTMRRTFVVLAAAGAMLSTAASPVLAAPLPIGNPGPDSGVQQVQYRHGYGHGHGYRHGYGHRHHRHYGGGAAVLGGLAAGAIIGGAIANSQAQSNAASYCAQRYRSYDPGSGTYLGHDGLRHPCP